MSNEDTERYREFISKLQRDEQRPAALNDIKNLFVLTPNAQAVTTIRNVGISKIVECLNVSDKTQTDLACEVLKICFDKFAAGDIVKNYTSHIMYLLRHEKACVRRLAIDEVHKILTTDPAPLPVTQYIDMFVAVAQMVSDTDVGVANTAVIITSNLPSEMYPKLLEEMKIALEYNSSSKCNAFEVIVNISTKSNDLFKLSAEMNYIDDMVAQLDSNDVLYQLNILELLSRLVAVPHGINCLVTKGILDNIAQLFNKLTTNALAGLLMPGYIKFFGCIAHYYPKEIFNKYPLLLDTLFEAIQSKDPLLPVALDTMGFIGQTIEGKLCLAALGVKYTQAIEQIATIIRNSSIETKIRALHCFADLISCENDPNKPKNAPLDHRVTLMTREWFRSLSASPSAIEALLDICKNPFPDIRMAGFILLDSVCQYRWGEELVATTAGFVEYVLDRSADHTKESKEAKYDIVKRLSNSDAFDSAIITRLKTYVEQGPFYSETQMEVAMEDGD